MPPPPSSQFSYRSILPQYDKGKEVVTVFKSDLTYVISDWAKTSHSPLRE